MIGAWIAIALILFGLPLLAWWVGNRRIWQRLRPGAERDPWRETMQRYGLSTAEAARLAREVPWGTAYDDPRLRQAAVAWAQTQIRQEAKRPTTTRGRVLLALALLCAAGVVGFLLYRVIDGRPEDVNWVTVVFYAGFAWYVLRRRRGLRRTIALNSDVGDRSA